jgi:hypothetical protein
MTFSTNIQGRPCGRPPAAAVLAPATTRRPPWHRPHPSRRRMEPPGRTKLCSAAAGVTHVGTAEKRCRMRRPSQAGTPRSRRLAIGSTERPRP